MAAGWISASWGEHVGVWRLGMISGFGDLPEQVSRLWVLGSGIGIREVCLGFRVSGLA